MTHKKRSDILKKLHISKQQQRGLNETGHSNKSNGAKIDQGYGHIRETGNI